LIKIARHPAKNGVAHQGKKKALLNEFGAGWKLIYKNKNGAKYAVYG